MANNKSHTSLHVSGQATLKRRSCPECCFCELSFIFSFEKFRILLQMSVCVCLSHVLCSNLLLGLLLPDGLVIGVSGFVVLLSCTTLLLTASGL